MKICLNILNVKAENYKVQTGYATTKPNEVNAVLTVEFGMASNKNKYLKKEN